MPNFNEDLNLLNPTLFVNDENINKPLAQLDENVHYILNYLDGNKALLAGVYGNLWDYNKEGKRILLNGGKFDSFRKCNEWIAINELRVVNDDQIIFDDVNNRCVFDGKSDNIEDREVWLEREFWIPEPLRNQKLIFAIKAAPSTSVNTWEENISFYETLAIQIIGGKEDRQVFKTAGVWNNQPYYSNESHGSNMTTIIVPFETNRETKSVKVKIFRTSNEGYLHIERVFLGGLSIPYDNDDEIYDLQNIDINEFYDFDNAVTKVNASTVLGHKVSDTLDNIVGNDLLTFAYTNKWMKLLLKAGSIFDCNTTSTTGTTGTSGTSGTSGTNIDVCLTDSYQGTFELNTVSKTYEVIHPKLDDDRVNSPNVSLVIPTPESAQYNLSVYDVTSTGFKILLSGVPFESGYKINWQLGSALSLEDMHEFLSLEVIENEEIPEPTIYPNIFNYESNA